MTVRIAPSDASSSRPHPSFDAAEGPRRTATLRSQYAQSNRQSVTWGGLENLQALSAPEKKLTETSLWCVAVSSVAFINVLALGLDADLRCRSNCSPGDTHIWTAIDAIITALFCLDVAIVFAVKGPSGFCQVGEGHEQRRVNYFRLLDVVLVLCRVVDGICESGGVQTNLKVFSAFRIMHVGSLVKALQVKRGFRELWLIMCAISETLRSVMWVTLLLLLVLWISAAAFTIAGKESTEVYDFSRAAWSHNEYWGSMTRALLSLFQVLTRDKWAEGLVWPLVEESPATMLFFILFISVASLALLNTVVGVIVESTLRGVRETAEASNAHKSRMETKLMAKLERLLIKADENYDGKLSTAEFGKMLGTSEAKHVLNKLDLTPADFGTLFLLLDYDSKGYVSTEVFLQNMTRIRGQAMTKDIYDVAVTLARQRGVVTNTTVDIKELQAQVSSLHNVITHMDLEMVHTPADLKDPALSIRRNRAQNVSKNLARVKNLTATTKLVSAPHCIRRAANTVGATATWSSDTDSRHEYPRSMRRNRASITKRSESPTRLRFSEALADKDKPEPPLIPLHLAHKMIASAPPHLPPPPATKFPESPGSNWGQDAARGKAKSKAKAKGATKTRASTSAPVATVSFRYFTEDSS